MSDYIRVIDEHLQKIRDLPEKNKKRKKNGAIANQQQLTHGELLFRCLLKAKGQGPRARAKG